MVAKAKTTTKTAKKPTKTAQPKTTAAKKATPSKRSKQMITDDDIARQAYMLWLERGGSEMENWLEAERQLR